MRPIFFFFYGVCLKNTFQLERRAAEVQKCSCFLHWNSFLFPSIAQWWRLHCSLLLLLWWWWWCCCASSPVVHAPHFHFFNQTNTDAAWWQRVDFPEWLCDCVEQLGSEGVQHWDHREYSRVIFQGDIPGWYHAEYKLKKKKKKTCVELFEKYSFSRLHFPEFKAQQSRRCLPLQNNIFPSNILSVWEVKVCSAQIWNHQQEIKRALLHVSFQYYCLVSWRVKSQSCCVLLQQKKKKPMMLVFLFNAIMPFVCLCV